MVVSIGSRESNQMMLVNRQLQIQSLGFFKITLRFVVAYMIFSTNPIRTLKDDQGV